MSASQPCVDCGGPCGKRRTRCMPCEHKRRAERTCEVVEDGVTCGRKHYGRGMCAMHNQRARKHGSPTVNVRDAHIAFVREAARTETDECIIPPWYAGERCVVKVGGVRRTASRQAWIERYGDPGARLVLHTCSDGSGDSGCINVRHLRLGDDAENTRDKIQAGRQTTTRCLGEEHGQAKLTREEVREIRRLAAAGTTHTAIAALMPVSRPTVSDIVRRRIWAWLDDEE